jgi:hypothetical protein
MTLVRMAHAAALPRKKAFDPSPLPVAQLMALLHALLWNTNAVRWKALSDMEDTA